MILCAVNISICSSYIYIYDNDKFVDACLSVQDIWRGISWSVKATERISH